MNAFDLACRIPWAITEHSLRQILVIANREHGGIAAAEAALGQKLHNTHAVDVRSGVAVIPVSGPIFRRASLITEISAATTVDQLSGDIVKALANPGVKGLVLSIDSPGGEVNGIHELADLVYRARGQKPITAYVGHQAASAAYWIASACDEIVCDATAALGSIGVIAAVPNPDADSAHDIEFVSTQSPKKRVDPRTESGAAEIQQQIDDLADVFIASVARHRGVSVDTVQSDFGQGGMLIGQKAVTAGLADRLGSLEQVLRDVAEGRAQTRTVPTRRSGLTPAAAHEESTMPSFKDTWAAFRANFQELDAAAHEDGDLLTSLIEEPTPPARPSASVDVSATLDATVRAEMETLKAQLAAANAARISAEAANFFTAQVTAGRALPAERDSLIALYTQAAETDGAHGTALLPALTAAIEARASHGLTDELVPSEAVAVVVNKTETPDPTKPREPDPARLAELFSLTPLGRAARDTQH